MRRFKPKVFFIGFNKNATVSFHWLFENSGYTSFHHVVSNKGNGYLKPLLYSRASWLFNNHKYIKFRPLTKENVNLAKRIKENFSDRLPILTGIDQADCYSDLCYYRRDEEVIEAVDYFEQFYEEYPNSYFVLQTRNINDWILSRMCHRGKKESFPEVAMQALGLSEEEVIEYWRNLRQEHYKKVFDFFKDKPNFIVYDIDTDNIDKLIDFVSKDFVLDKSYWQQHNSTSTKRRQKIKKRLN